MSLTLEITDQLHYCAQQYCSAWPPPVFYLAQGPAALVGGTPGTTLRSISESDPLHPVTKSHYWVMVSMDWTQVVQVSGAMTIQFTTGFGIAQNSRLRWVHLCKLDNYVGCANVKELGQSDDRNITLVSNTVYTIPIYNTAGTPGTNPTVPNCSGTECMMFVFVFSGPQTSGYNIPFYYAGQVVLSGFSLVTAGGGPLVQPVRRLRNPMGGRLIR